MKVKAEDGMVYMASVPPGLDEGDRMAVSEESGWLEPRRTDPVLQGRVSVRKCVYPGSTERGQGSGIRGDKGGLCGWVAARGWVGDECGWAGRGEQCKGKGKLGEEARLAGRRRWRRGGCTAGGDEDGGMVKEEQDFYPENGDGDGDGCGKRDLQ